MSLLWLLFLCLSLSGSKGGRPQTADFRPPYLHLSTASPDDGSTELQEEDSNEKDETDEAEWKLEFENGTTIKGVGSPPRVWHLVGSSEMKEGSSWEHIPIPSQEEPQDDENTEESLVPNKEAKEDTGKAYRKMDLVDFCPCKCPDALELVCASDGVTYDNKCRMTCSACVVGEKIEVVSKGKCEDSMRLLPYTHY